MKVALDNSSLNKLYKILENKEININLADMLIDFFTYVDVIKETKNENDYLDKMLEFWELDKDDVDNMDIINKQLKNYIKELDPSVLTDNPYYKNIKISPCKVNNCSLDFEYYYPYQGFSYDDIKILDDYKEANNVGYFKKKIPYPVLKHNKDVWMSITPNEINTMKESIARAHGNVLVYGLGLGYYPYMLTFNIKVKSITIIEKDKNVIQLFNERIFNQFSKDIPIKIINEDALTYRLNNQYDYAFVDLWHDPLDGIDLYIKFKKIEKNNHNVEFSYWLETSILSLYRRCLLTVIEESLNNFKDSDYMHAENSTDIIINNLYFKTKNVVIDSYDKLLDFLGDDNLKKLMV